MPKRSVDRPYQKNRFEQARVNQRCYGQMESEQKKINPIFLERPHYGISDPVNGVVKVGK